MPTFINPFTDFGFKRLFGQEDSKIILIGFLNALFEDEFVVTDLEYRDKEQLRERPDSRNAIFDIFCTLDTSERIILEMQNNYQKHFEDRALYYASRGIARQGQSHCFPTATYVVFYKRICSQLTLLTIYLKKNEGR